MTTTNMEAAPMTETRLSYEAFRELPDWQRMKIIADNRVINTDTYNRTMDYLRGPEGWRETETYTLQMRRSPYNYLVVAGVEDAVAELTDQPITQAEVDFAEEFYTKRDIPFFNRAMWQAVVDEHEGILPFEITGATDGTVTLPGEPILRVTGPGELVAHFEHLFHRPFYSTLVATKAHEITKLLGDPDRFIEVGKRGVPTELTHLQAVKAMQVGGDLRLTSDDAAVAAFEGARAIGTIGHRYVQRFPSVEAAFRHAIENLDAVSLLVDLIESYGGLDLALKLKEEYRATHKEIDARLDSDDVKEQAIYYHHACEKLGFTDPAIDKLIIEGIDSLTEMADIEVVLTEEQKKRTLYGAGELLVAQDTTRSKASTGLKLSEYEGEDGEFIASNKFSNDPDKHSIPGEPTIAVIDGQRMIAQAEEVTAEQDLLTPLYTYGNRRPNTPIPEAQEARKSQYAALLPTIEAKQKPVLSPRTRQKIAVVMARYGLVA